MGMFNHYKKKIGIFDYLIKEDERPSKGEYTGERNKKGLPHGKGRMIYEDGRIYEGDWENGKRSGNGIIEYNDGSEYEGERKNDMPYGYGNGFINVEVKGSRCVYGGEFYNGIFHGNGSLNDSENHWYIGERKNGKKNGKGSSYFPGFTEDAAGHCISGIRENDDMIKKEMSYQIDYDTFELKMEEKIRNKFHNENNGKESNKKIEYNKDEYHCCRIMGEAHKTGDYSKLFNLLSEDCTLDAQSKNFEKIEGKKAVIEYYKTKEKETNSLYETVKLVGNMKKIPTKVKLANDTTSNKAGDTIGLQIMYEEGKICLMLIQFWDTYNEIRQHLIHIDINKKGEISKIFIARPDFYDYENFTLPTDYEECSYGKDWYPKYDEDNVLNDQELQSNAMRVAFGVLRHEGFKIITGQHSLIGFPNFRAEKNGKKLYIAVRGIHLKDRIGERAEDGLYPYEVYSKNLMDSYQLKTTKKIAQNAGAEYHYFIVYMRNSEQKLKKNGIVMRGKWEYDLCRLEPGDF